jgi:cytochrome P450
MRRYATLRGSGAPCDLAAELCVPVVATMTVDLLGCEDCVTPEQMARWGPLVSQGAFDFHAFPTGDEELADAREQIAALAADFATGRRRARPDTVLGRLAGMSSSADEIRRTVEFMIIGADAGPREGVSTVLACVLSADPAVRAGLVDSPAARQGFVDEAQRWESPIGAVTRECRVDIQLAGTAVPRGTRVLGALGSANRDPARWPRPDSFVADRGDRAHLSFGAGMHGCIGAAITRRLADAVILAAATDPTVALRSAPEYRGWWYRGPAALPVCWT